MSALNAFATDGATFLFSDAAVCHSDSLSVFGLINKVAILPQYTAAVSATGHTFAIESLFNALAARDFADFTHLIDNTPDVLWNLAKEMPAEGFRIAIAGPGLLFCIQTEGIRAERYEMTECSDFMSPGVSDVQFDADRPAESGLAIMLAQREKFGVIGGWCQMTTVRANHIETRILERWPDKIGELINPMARLR
jgi:hypothetical protein